MARVASGMNRLVRRQGHAGGIARSDSGVVAERARRTRQDRLADRLVRRAGDVVHLESVASFSRIEILAAQLQASDRIAGVLMRGLQLLVQVLVAAVVVGIGIFLQVAADDS